MNKKMRELQAAILEKTEEAKGYMTDENKDLDKAETLLNEADALQKEYDIEARIVSNGKKGAEGAEPAEGQKIDGIKALAAAARSGFKAMSEGTPADGGYTVPQDIMTRIHEFAQNHFNLASLISVETVGTNKGSRVYKTRAQQTGFSKVGEGAAIGQKNGPQFSVVEYIIEKFAGYLPVTNELLADSDAAIASVIMEWLAGESVATDNAQILAKFKTAVDADTDAAVAITSLDDIKRIIIKTLSAFKASTSIVTNDDGILWLDTLKDENGRYLLTPNPSDSNTMRLTIGGRSVPVVQVPSDILANSVAGAIPFFIGDPRQFMKKFDRAQLSIMQSKEAAVGDFNAFEEDMTLFRGIMRADYETTDTAALVFAELTLTA